MFCFVWVGWIMALTAWLLCNYMKDCKQLMAHSYVVSLCHGTAAYSGGIALMLLFNAGIICLENIHTILAFIIK